MSSIWDGPAQATATTLLVVLPIFAYALHKGLVGRDVAASLLVAALARTWGHVASHFVPEPYLVSPARHQPILYSGLANTHQDEIFHVPQAQKYCEGRFTEWDDKITTPPGLYVPPPTNPYAPANPVDT